MDLIPSWIFFGMALVCCYKNPGLPMIELSVFGDEETTVPYLIVTRDVPKTQDFESCAHLHIFN